MTYRKSAILFAPAVVMFLGALAWARQAENSARMTVWTGIYSLDQANRGAENYNTNCAGCHQSDLDRTGSARFTGRTFMERWREYDVESFYNFIKVTMPRSKPGSLSDSTYLNIVAHILHSNEFPAGNSDLTLDALKKIQIEGKDGPKPVPNGALVQLVGCLRQRGTGWVLTNASEPARTSSSDKSTPDEMKTAETKELGALEFRLDNLGYLGTDFNPQSHSGHKMQTKGYLVRQPNMERINLTSMEMIASSCQP